MHCFVYASVRKPETYLWLDSAERATTLPERVSQLTGELRLVLELELAADRQLPREDAATILEHLQTRGWHLQMPPPEPSSP